MPAHVARPPFDPLRHPPVGRAPRGQGAGIGIDGVMLLRSIIMVVLYLLPLVLFAAFMHR